MVVSEIQNSLGEDLDTIRYYRPFCEYCKNWDNNQCLSGAFDAGSCPLVRDVIDDDDEDEYDGNF